MKIQKTKTPKKVFIVPAIIIVALIAYGVASYALGLWPFQKKSTDNASHTTTQSNIDQQKDSFAQKESDAQSAGTSNNSGTSNTGGSVPTTQTKAATVVVTYASQDDDGTVEVNSYIPDYYKDGTCTLTFTKGSQKLTRSTPAYRDATTTICTNPLIKGSDFPETGTWSLVVSYAADGGAGASDPQNITIR